MLEGIDISNYQRGLDLAKVRPGFAIVKATESDCWVDPSCDGFVQQCIGAAIPFGFYHFASGTDDAARQARWFRANTRGYEGKGIPVLDFEMEYEDSFIDVFVKEYHAITGVWPWVYMNSNFVNSKGYGSEFVKARCGLWLAGYPQVLTTYPAGKECPYKHDGWTLAAWQFTDKLSCSGMSVDGDVFYGGTSAWQLYATGGESKVEWASYSDYHLARMVIDGAFGDGATRRAKLGDRHKAVQAAVNDLLLKSDRKLAELVWAGVLGEGDERRYVLGNRYKAVQRLVNMGVGR